MTIQSPSPAAASALTTTSDAMVDVADAPFEQGRAGSIPRLATVLLGMVAIALAAAALAALAVALALLAVLARSGQEGLAEFLQQARFDPLLGLQLGAGGISLLYIGLALATLGAAWLVGGRGWRHLLALGAAQPGSRGAAILCVVTLLYAAVLTCGFAWMQGRHAAADGPTNVLLLTALLGNYVVLAPIAEELLFRGWLYTGLRARLGFIPSFTLTTVAFVAIHWDASHRRILLVLPLAIALGALRELCGSIRPTLVLHSGYNALIVGITLALA